MDDADRFAAADRLPPLTALRAFEAAARLRSFARAADELGVTPAAISQQIQALESLSGQPLFRRLGRGIELTDAGEAARPLAVEGMALLAEAARAMRMPHRSLRVAVSASPSFAAKWLTPRLARFQARRPDVAVWLTADPGLVDFAQADVDLAIRYGPGDHDRANAQLLLSESVAPAASPALIAAAGGLARVEDLAPVPLIHEDGADRDPSCPGWPAWLSAQGAGGVEARRGLRFNQASLVIDAAVAGEGAALVKMQLAAEDLAAGRLAVVLGAAPTPVGFGYWMVWPRGRTMSEGLKAFMAWLRDEAGGSEPDLGGGI